MLIRLTNRCAMQCRHCMVDAQPDGDEHMNVETFKRAIRWAQRFDNGIMLLSGGEPTEHPDILRMLEIAVFSLPMPHVTLLSNGLFLQADDLPARQRRELIIDACDSVQVTNDPRYYPIHVEDPGRAKVHVERHIRQITPVGRAKDNAIPSTRKSPTCFNLRSAVRTLGNLPAALAVLRTRGYFCTPSVNPSGRIVAGEMPSCAFIGTLDSDESTLVRNLQNLRCDACGLVASLSDEHRAAIEGT
jgi:hypothetical protein